MKPHVLAAIVFFGLPLTADGQATQRETMRFRAMDVNNDGVIARTEWRGSDRSFRAHDWNGDGVLSGDEVRPGAAPDRGEEDFDQNQREFRNWTGRGFNNLDHNRSGRIERSEWHYDLEAFNRADRNRDNVLTRAEFLGDATDMDREDRFDYLDSDNNGRIERTEWHASPDAFRWLDRDSDGSLSRSEVVGDEAEEADLFASLDMNEDDVVTQDEWHWSRRSFNRQDANRDGRLTRGELTNAELSTAGAVGTSGRSVVVDSAERWVDTGIDVRNGDTIAIQASGTVTLSTNRADTASPAGASRRAEAAPLRDRPAGALIARIADGPPIFVGEARTITANTSGRLYLGVNDDHFADNRGQFTVSVQPR